MPCTKLLTNSATPARFALLTCIILLTLACSMEPPSISPATTAPALKPTPTTAPTVADVARATTEPIKRTSMPTVVLPLTVAEPDRGLSPYDRDDWRHWTDEDGDCQDARNEVLVAESVTSVTFKSDRECRVESGRWLAPYSAAEVTSPGDLDIDHMVPLANAHRSGAWQWTPERKREYANYLEDDHHLIAVTAKANRSKGAKGPEEWRPPDQDYWCQYAVDWTTIKISWNLTVTPAEFKALEEMLQTCETPYQLITVTTMKKPNLPSLRDGGSPTPVPTEKPPAEEYDSCAAAEAAGEPLVQGDQGTGRGFPKAMVPKARDGDGDGVVCER